MSVFGTEFPVRQNLSKGDFIAQVFAWLRGIKNSSVLESCTRNEIDGSNARLTSPSGEEIYFREVEGDNIYAIGVRHEIPDSEGRIWRTEIVLRSEKGISAIVRVNSKCISNSNGVWLETPRRPYIIRSMIEDGISGFDGIFNISNNSIYLKKDEIEISKKIIDGDASKFLPILYFSVNSKDKICLPDRDIDAFSKIMGGVAHVIIEPSISFSMEINGISDGKRVSGGSVGLFLPSRGLVGRFFLDPGNSDKRAFCDRLRSVAVSARARMVNIGWDWVDLQEFYLKENRRKENNRLSAKDMDALYREEIENKDEIIDELRKSIDLIQREPGISSDIEDVIISEKFRKIIGSEVYSGEFSDRVRCALSWFVARAEDDGVDDRTKFVIRSIVDKSSYSDGVRELVAELRRASRGGSSDFMEVLQRIGFIKKGSGKHFKMSPVRDGVGLPTFTIPKTPSDHRSQKNMLSDIEKNLGLSKFKF